MVDDKGKIKFDRRDFDLDNYCDILEVVDGLQMKDLKVEKDFVSIKYASDKDAKEETAIKYADNLTQAEIMHLESDLLRICVKCRTIKLPHSHHCSTCRRCIARMDHHCPWVNNCVGYFNRKHFMLFLFYTFVGSSHAFLNVTYSTYYCYRLDKKCHIFKDMGKLSLYFFAIILSLLFAIFVGVMANDQYECFSEHRSTIDKLKFKRAKE